MKRVGVAVALAVALATACAPEPRAAAPPTEPAPPSASASPVSDYELVRAAFRRTRAAATGQFVGEVTLEMKGAGLTVRRSGAYDVPRRLARVEQTFSAYPAELLDRMAEGRPGADLRATVVIANRTMYLNMPGWRPPARGRWLMMTAAELADTTGVGLDVESGPFPPILAMFAHVKPSADDGSRRDEVPSVARVAVPAKDAFLAGPSNIAARLVAKGYDVNRITGSVEVEVVIERGLITKVSFDAARAVEQALEDTEQQFSFDAVPTSIVVSAHGKRPHIAVPPPSLVARPGEFGLPRR